MKKVTRSLGARDAQSSGRKPRTRSRRQPSFFAKLTGILDPQILLVGDSWAYFLGGSPFPRALVQLGYDQWATRHIAARAVGHRLVAVPASRAVDWRAGSLWMKNLEFALRTQSEIRVVHLSLGGNDFIWGWRGRKSEKALLAKTFSHVAGVLELITSLRPDVVVSYHSYDWPNLEPVDYVKPRWMVTHGLQRGFVKIFHALAGSPTHDELNAALHRFCEAQHAFVETHFPDVEFWEHLGFGHWIVGNKEEIDLDVCRQQPNKREALQPDGFHYNLEANTALACELLMESYLKRLALPKRVRKAEVRKHFQQV